MWSTRSGQGGQRTPAGGLRRCWWMNLRRAVGGRPTRLRRRRNRTRLLQHRGEAAGDWLMGVCDEWWGWDVLASVGGEWLAWLAEPRGNARTADGMGARPGRRDALDVLWASVKARRGSAMRMAGGWTWPPPPLLVRRSPPPPRGVAPGSAPVLSQAHDQVVALCGGCWRPVRETKNMTLRNRLRAQSAGGTVLIASQRSFPMVVLACR